MLGWLKRCPTLLEEKSPLLFRDESPCAGKDICKLKLADANADKPKRWVASGGCHPSDLAVFAFHQFQTNPAGRNGFAKTNRRIAGRYLRLRIQKPCAALTGFSALDNGSGFELV